MEKIINPCQCECYNGRKYQAYAKIEYEAGRLSICGVIGPMANGNCQGSAGQCVNEIRKGIPEDGWTREMLDKFCDIWDQWHLNDMRPYCQHQKERGWDKAASEYVPIYHYRLTNESLQKQKEAKRAALAALEKGETFTPTVEQVKYAALEYRLDSPYELIGEYASLYSPNKPLYPGDDPFVTSKAKGWLRLDEHPDGLLGKPCPVCGYKYGTSWLTEDVPQDVIDWLFALPDTVRTPAWV